MARTLVLFPGSLGDCICFLPALQALGTRGKELVVAGREMTGAVLGALSFLPQKFSLQTVSIERDLFAHLFTPPSDTKDERLEPFFSSVTDVFSWSGSLYPSVRMNFERYCPGRVYIFPFFSGQTECHASTYYLRCIGIGEGRSPSPGLALHLEEEWQQWGEEYWRRNGWSSTLILVIQPGSGGVKKRWAADGYERVSQWWMNTSGQHVCILLGPAETGEAVHWKRFGRVESSLELAQVASILSRATLYIGNDSGVSHLAGAVGARGVAIFGPTRPDQWRPLGGAITVVRNHTYRKENPNREGISLEEVPVQQVIDLLDQWSGSEGGAS